LFLSLHENVLKTVLNVVVGSIDAVRYCECVVRRKRLELLRLAALEPKSSASTNSATLAKAGFYLIRTYTAGAMPVDHYENFPVASLLLPPALREPVTAIYVFARNADDFSDEGDLLPAERLAALGRYSAELDAIERDESSSDPVFIRLRLAIKQYRLPLSPFRDLLDAFVQDVGKDRYASHAELIDYCRRSANPVGQLMLHLFSQATPANMELSDSICTALQLINHWQDVAIDWQKGEQGRLYLPQDELLRFGVSEQQIDAGVCNEHWHALMAFQVDRTRALMLEGAPLGRLLPGRIGLEIRAIVAGGLRILDKIEAVDYDVFRQRPVLSALDWPRILLKAL
jgi:squalene synthase HpnC